MLKSYFFIPASNTRFIDKMKSLQADEFVFDLEDAIAKSDIDVALVNLSRISEPQKFWVRPRIFKNEGEIYNTLLESLFELRFKKFVLPKVETYEQLESIYNVFEYFEITDFEWILLIESPLALLNLETLLKEKRFPIKGVALGAHDYAAQTQMTFSEERILWARTQVLNTAYAYGVTPIDYASMELANPEKFKADTLEGFRMGYKGKIVIHPNQLNILQDIEYYTIDEIDHAIRISRMININQTDKMQAMLVDGKIYELPHLEQIKRILAYAQRKNML